MTGFWSYGFLQLSLAGCAALGLALGGLGAVLIARRLSLYGDALGHAVLPGVVVGHAMGGGPEPGAGGYAGMLAGALASGGLAAVLVSWLSRAGRGARPDVAMAVVFSGLFGLGVAILSVRQAGSAGVGGFLFGRALALTPLDVGVAWAALALIALWLATRFRALTLWLFDPVQAELAGVGLRRLEAEFMALLTLTVVAGLQAVGALLVAALLVAPAAAAFLAASRFPAVVGLSMAFGLASTAGGLGLSHAFGWATGAAMVLVGGGLVALAGAGRSLARALSARRAAA